MDNGIGIAQENMGRLFQAFSQIDSSLARQFQGTGLGLAMVKQLVELQGGAIAVASAEGEGSRFAVWLPLSSSPLGSTAVNFSAAGANILEFDGRTALVVEDDDGAAELVRMLLEAEGFAVVRATEVEEAMVMAAQQPLSLITLDVDLPVTDGWEFLNRIREDSQLSHVPVVVIIANQLDGNLAGEWRAPRPSCRSRSAGRCCALRWPIWGSMRPEGRPALCWSSTTTPRRLR